MNASKKYEEERRKYKEKHPRDVTNRINFLKEKNKKCEEKYPEEWLQRICLRWYYMEDIEKLLPKEMLNHFKDLFKEIYTTKEQFREIFLWYRFAENTGTNRKLNRVIDEQLFQKFWMINYDEAQINFAIAYIMDNMQSLVIDDMKINVIWWNDLFWTDKALVKSILQELLDKWKSAIDTKRGLAWGNHTQLA